MGKKKGKSKGNKQIVSTDSTKETFTPDLNSDVDEMDVIAAALSTANQAVFMKVCRLCESKDGPFLNIFDADKVTAKKIDELMPFGVAENDDLPHKICFRCSAKVEELHEFIQKCIKTQNSLRKAMGKREPLAIKPKTRVLWEEKLNKSNMSNDDICDALIKKAMEGIKDIPLSSLATKEEKPPVTQKKDTKPKETIPPPSSPVPKKETRNKIQEDIKSDGSDQSLTQSKSDIPIESKFIPSRASRSKNATENLLDGLQDVKRKKPPSKQNDTKPMEVPLPDKKSKGINDFSFDYDDSYKNSKTEESPKPTPVPVVKETKQVEEKKPFNIMDYISMIKVNSVGVLFQCSLCNRNFLKKELVMTHGCAKNGGVPKVDFTKKIAPPVPPKVPAVKYINTKVDSESNKPSIQNKPENIKQEVDTKTPLETKPKPRIGPASKVKRQDNYSSVIGMTVVPMEMNSSTPKPASIPTPPVTNTVAPPVAAPSVQFPTLPSLNSRYKLVPGPNNTFQLVEESINPEPEVVEETKVESKPRKRKSDPPKPVESKARKQNGDNSKSKTKSPEIIDVDDPTPPLAKASNVGGQPYPVGLFQTVAHPSGLFAAPVPVAADPPFTTPAMKKQSYTVVQTGNPSKLLISTKPQIAPEEAPKKRSKKSKPEAKTKPDDKAPFTVTLEDASPAKDSGFFTFINVDPLLQPSYVLPTDNIIQESQISTSTPAAKAAVENKEKDKYTCNMCEESFSREKKLLTHIQSHYNKMDEEDQLRAGSARKRSAKKH